ncbi:MAG: SDR family oxidoreductase [Chloroflexota bacterium]|nr:NmrA/HSCARG family protein [Chloroflexota bacterium]MBI5703584.1 NmrA/HSCARG family protein [Chloroflexota bacterium]
MILITGAAGKTGQAIIRALRKRGEALRAVARRPEQADALKALGVEEVIVGDLLDGPEMKRAVQGARAVYHIAPNVNPHEVAIGRNVIAAAKSAQVERFVFHSVLHPQVEAMPHHWQKMRVEELLFESGLPFTILQPTAYMQNILAYWQSIREQGVYAVPYPPQTRLSLVDLEDVAEAAALVLTEGGWLGATLELVGTAPLSQTDLAEILSRRLNRPVRAAAVPLETWEQNARSSGMGEYQITALMQMFRYYARHGLIGSPSVLKCLLRRPPASFEDFIERTIWEQNHAY